MGRILFLAAVLAAACSPDPGADTAPLPVDAAKPGPGPETAAAAPEKAPTDPQKSAATASTVPVAYHPDWKAIPLDAPVQKGLDWLVSVQGSDGGWGQDGGRTEAPRRNERLESSGNDVANTALACLALMRAGTVPGEGKHKEALKKGIEFILARVEGSPVEGLELKTPSGTQIQRKLGPHIDTFLANMVLAEIDGVPGGAIAQQRIRASLEKCVAKIEKNQGKDGSWNAGGGWAPILSTSVASRGLFVAQTKGVAVKEEVLASNAAFNARKFDERSGRFEASDGAGVELYAAAQALEVQTRTERDRAENAASNASAVAKLGQANFVGGFGSMGGEEFVSYMNISDALIRTGGEEWKRWNSNIKDRLVKLQNQDGTWAGHHCITGRVACTSAAVMTLMTERGLARAQ